MLQGQNRCNQPRLKHAENFGSALILLHRPGSTRCTGTTDKQPKGEKRILAIQRGLPLNIKASTEKRTHTTIAISITACIEGWYNSTKHKENNGIGHELN